MRCSILTDADYYRALYTTLWRMNERHCLQTHCLADNDNADAPRCA